MALAMRNTSGEKFDEMNKIMKTLNTFGGTNSANCYKKLFRNKIIIKND